MPELSEAELLELEEELHRRERALSIPLGYVVWTMIDGHLAPWSIVDLLNEEDGPRVEILTSTSAVTFVLTLDDAQAARYPLRGEEHLLLSIGAARSYLLRPYWADAFTPSLNVMVPGGDATLVKMTEGTPIHEQHDARCAYRALYDPTRSDLGGWVEYRAISANAGLGWARPDPDWLAGLEELVAAGYAERRSEDERDYVSAWRLTDQGAILHSRFGVE